MSGIPDFKNLVFKDTSFANLMNKRIYNVLLIATKYDAFMLEDDGRVDEQIFNEYTSLSLRYPPRFTQVTTEEEALAELKDRNFELIICMPNMDNRDIFAAATEIKIHYPNIPIVCVQLVGKCGAVARHNQADRGQDECAGRYGQCRCADYLVGGRFRPFLFFGFAASV